MDPSGKTFSEHGGKPSTMRALAVGALVIAGLLAANDAALAWYDKAGNPLTVLYFLAAAFGGKAGQRFIEGRTPKP